MSAGLHVLQTLFVQTLSSGDIEQTGATEGEHKQRNQGNSVWNSWV